MNEVFTAVAHQLMTFFWWVLLQNVRTPTYYMAQEPTSRPRTFY